uniref:Uncharacterized protein n=1 Tax=Leersia perrieri TaxID=77586 RepID=A0A0D9V6H4_9ORYZ
MITRWHADHLEVDVHGAVDAVIDGAGIVGHDGSERLELGKLEVGIGRNLSEVPVHELGDHGDRRKRRRARAGRCCLRRTELARALLRHRRRRVPRPHPVRRRHEVVQYPLHAVDVVQRLDGVPKVGHEQVVEARVLQLRPDPSLQVLAAERAGVEEHRRAEHPEEESGGRHALLRRQQRHDLLQEIPLVPLRRRRHVRRPWRDASASSRPVALHRLDQPLEHRQAQERHVLVPPVHRPGARRRRRHRRAATRRADAVPERVVGGGGDAFGGGRRGGCGGVGGASLGGERGDASGDDVEVLGGGEHVLAGLERLDGVLPVGEHVGEERLRLRDEVALGVIVGHAQVLRRAPEAHHVVRVQLDLDVVAEPRRQLERLGAARDVVQLQRAHAAAATDAVLLRRRLVLADHPLQHAAPAQQRELHATHQLDCFSAIKNYKCLSRESR